MRWLGGIAVNRGQSGNMVAALAQALRGADGAVQLVVPPECARAKTRHWKASFYWIAYAAGVPTVLAYMDNPRKQSGLRPVFLPTGDVDTDLAQIEAWHAQWRGKNAGQFDNL